MTIPLNKQVTRQLAQADLLLLMRDVLLCHIARPELPVDMDPTQWEQLLTTAELDDAATLSSNLYEAMGQLTNQGLDELVVVHASLFEGRMMCPITETAYVRRDKGAITADIAGFYQAFGFESAGLGEKQDHLAVELEFVAMLLIMEAQARAEGNTEAAEITATAITSFIRDHIGDWVLPFCSKLIEVSPLVVHERCATLIRAIFLTLARTHAIEALVTMATPSIDDPQGPYECGMVEHDPIVPLTAKGSPVSPAESDVM